MLIGKKNLADNHLLSSVAIFNKIGLLVNLIPLVIFLALFGISGFFNSAIAASSTRSPATATSADTYCTKGDESCWQDIDKVYVSDGQTAGSFYTAEYLIAKNFGFSIPSNATINGITAEIQRRESSTNDNCFDSHVYLTKIGDTAVGSNKQNAGEWPTSFAYATYGSSSDLWGSSWTYSEVNSSNFGLMINLSGGVSYCLIDHIRITVTYTTNTAPTISINPYASYGSYTRTGPSNTPFTVSFTATDAEQNGANQLTYYIHTGANRTGTQVSTGTFTSGATSKTIAYNASGLSQGSNPLYLSVYDGAVYSSTNPSFTVYRDDTTPSASGISHNPNPVTSTNQYTTTFTVNDTYSTNGGEQRWWVRTASGGGGTQLASGTATAGNQVTTGTITTDTALTNGASRYIRLCDGANNCSDTSFTVVKSSAPTISSPTQTNKTHNSITLGGNITDQGGSAVDIKGVCYSVTITNASPEHGGTGVTCANHASGGTGIFTVDLTGLLAETGYSYKAFAHNTQGYAYTSADTFTTLTNAPTSVTTNNESELGSYKVRFHGSANPNGSQAYGYFRFFTEVPDCSVDAQGTRVPSSSSFDYNLGSGSATVNFDIPTPSTINLTRNTDYWYCAYARNVAAGAGSPGTSSAAGYDTFTTTDGPASGCDAPASGNMTVTESCSFPQTDYDGVDSGGNTSVNSAALVLGAGGRVTLLPGQIIGTGAKIFQGGSFVNGNGSSGVILGAGVWLKDSDNDGYIDSPVTKIISRNQPTGYKRRNYVYTLPTYNTTSFNYASKIYNAATTASTYLDCDETNGYIYREVANLVTDADNDGYKTSASAGPQCVGASTVINGRTYYNGGSGPN